MYWKPHWCCTRVPSGVLFSAEHLRKMSSKGAQKMHLTTTHSHSTPHLTPLLSAAKEDETSGSFTFTKEQCGWMNVNVFRAQCLLRARLDGSEEAGCKIEMWLRRNNMARLWFPRRCHELLLQQEACRAWHLQTHFYCRKKKRRKEPLTEE